MVDILKRVEHLLGINATEKEKLAAVALILDEASGILKYLAGEDRAATPPNATAADQADAQAAVVDQVAAFFRTVKAEV